LKILISGLSRGYIVKAFQQPSERKEKSMKHSLKISIGDGASSGVGIIGCRVVSIRERFIRWLFGSKQRITILIPGRSIESMDIQELPDAGGEV
jgi:hypothetical protein